MLEENSQIYSVRIYASSGTLSGREGPFGVADQKTWNGQHLLAAFSSIPLWQRGIKNPETEGLLPNMFHSCNSVRSMLMLWKFF